MKNQKPKESRIKIDATGQKPGRLAVTLTNALRGKDKPSFTPNKVPNLTVIVYNTDRLEIAPKKAKQKIYYAHSGYPGGLSEEDLESLFKRDSRQVIIRAVYGMLPKNKLRDKFIKNLKVYKREPAQ